MIQPVNGLVCIVAAAISKSEATAYGSNASDPFIWGEGGRYMNRVFLLIFLAGSFAPVVRGQEEIHQQLNTVAVQEQKGEYDQAIFTLRSLIETGTAASSEIGRCWTLLGIALEQQGQFSQSQSAYENAIRLLESDKQRLDQYASALDSIASLNSI